jgi:NADH-quinone oxidoreductase subunit C
LFKNNFDLRRILTDYGFNGHPLQKNFPLTGFFELFYNDPKKRLNYDEVSLSQEYRSFIFRIN